MTAEQVRERIEVAYMAATKSETPHGAQRWAAKRLRVTDRLVRGWLVKGLPGVGCSQGAIELLTENTRLAYGEAALIQAAQQRTKLLRGAAA